MGVKRCIAAMIDRPILLFRRYPKSPCHLQIPIPFFFTSHRTAGYTAKQVKALLARVGGGAGNPEGSKLKRVVMLSSVGVNRRDDLMLKLRQMHTNLEERVRACVRVCNR